jgi:formylglycine-generating enzyme required for sulfatase activity
MPVPVLDASTEAGSTEDAAPIEEGCRQDLKIEPSCVHPPVVKNCTEGWCTIPAGCFVMGSPLCEKPRGARGEPQSQTTLTRSFVMQQHELTIKEWTRFGWPNPAAGVAQSGNTACDAQDCPATYVQHYDAMMFANRLSEAEGKQQCYRLLECTGQVGKDLLCTKVEQTTGSLYDCLGYRLPTEAEWEYAYRAGTTTGYYSGPSTPLELGCTLEPPADRIGWYCNNAGKTSHPVGQKLPNAWGLFDMAGNAAELTSDVFTPQGYGAGPRTSPGATLQVTSRMVMRGGGFVDESTVLKAGWRWETNPKVRVVRDGFRLVRTLP